MKNSSYPNERLTWADTLIVPGQALDLVAQWFALCEKSWPMFFKAEGFFESDFSRKILNQNLLAYRVLVQNPEMRQVPFPLLRSVGRAFCAHREGKPVAGCNDFVASFPVLSVSRDNAGLLEFNKAWICEHFFDLNTSALSEEKTQQLKHIQNFSVGDLFLLSKKEDGFHFVIGFKASVLQFLIDREKRDAARQLKKIEADDIPF